MQSKILLKNEKYTIKFIWGFTKFKGCRCYKPCICKETFESKYVELYWIRKQFNKVKVSIHSSKEEALNRFKYLETLPVHRIVQIKKL